MESVHKISFLGDYVNGEFVRSRKPDGSWQSKSPGDLKDQVIDIEYSYENVDTACEAANEAYKNWKKTSFETRKNYLMRLKELYLTNKDLIARTISRETGKPLWETLGEVQSMI